MNSLPPNLCKAVELDTYLQPSKFFVCNAIYIFLGKKEKWKCFLHVHEIYLHVNVEMKSLLKDW